MNTNWERSRRSWLARNRLALISAAAIAAYAIFVEWVWGWPVLLRQWAEIGVGPVLSALALLVATYFIRCYRIHDYFPGETRGRFLSLFRVTQVHNLLNIMLPFRAGETSFPLLMRSEFGVPLVRGTAALFVMRLLDLHALLTVAAVGLVAGRGQGAIGWVLWLIAFLSPLAFFLMKEKALTVMRRVAPAKAGPLLDEAEAGLPIGIPAFLRAWAMTMLNWAVKVVVLAWVLAIMGVAPLAASFGGRSVANCLPCCRCTRRRVWEPTQRRSSPARFPSERRRISDARTLGRASVNAHLMVIVSAVAGTMLSLLLRPKA